MKTASVILTAIVLVTSPDIARSQSEVADVRADCWAIDGPANEEGMPAEKSQGPTSSADQHPEICFLFDETGAMLGALISEEDVTVDPQGGEPAVDDSIVRKAASPFTSIAQTVVSERRAPYGTSTQ